MPLARIKIENYKSIKYCDISIDELNLLIGGNGTGKTNILDAIDYFYKNITSKSIKENIYDLNNKFSNCVRISLFFDMTNFSKIAKKNTDSSFLDFDDDKEENKYENYYKSILSLTTKVKLNLLCVELTQIKGKGIMWNCSYEERSIIKSLYPFFYVDTRNLDITKWSYIWDILAEIGKVSNRERGDMEKTIQELVEGNGELSKKIKGIKEIFDSANVNVQRLTSKEFAKSLTNIYFSGETIQQKGKQLDYFSTGTNSVKYIELLLKSIEELTKTKMKEPIILLDEPEISLHPNFIDELSYAITSIKQKFNIIISTHSARLIKNILITSQNTYLYSVSLVDKYTLTKRMKKFPQYSPKSKYRVTDEHVNSYFSKSILFVEGETEMELFSNPYLKLLFPKLKKVDVFQAMAQEPELNIMNPNKTGTNIPYICLIDMDKALEYNINNRTLSLKKEFFKVNKKERFMYRNKKETHTFLFHQRIHVQKMADNLKVHFLKPIYSCVDSMFFNMLKTIKDYLLNYRIFAFTTTVEGALINENTYDTAMSFLKKVKNEENFRKFEEMIEQMRKTDKINILRLVYGGKTDLLQSYKTIKKNLAATETLIIDNVMLKKASGWVSDFLDDFFEKFIEDGEEITIKRFEKLIEEDNARISVVKEFAYYFSEIYTLIEKIEV